MRGTLADLILEVKDTSGEADPKHIAKLVIDKVSSRDLRDALAETLPDYVRTTIHRAAGQPIGVSPSSATASTSGSSTRATPRSAPAPHVIKDAVAKVLAMSVCIDAQAGTWIHYGKMGRKEIRAAGKIKMDIADQTRAAAQRMFDVEPVLDKYKVDLIEQLPPDVILATKP
jgi:hypothetical protein